MNEEISSKEEDSTNVGVSNNVAGTIKEIQDMMGILEKKEIITKIEILTMIEEITKMEIMANNAEISTKMATVETIIKATTILRGMGISRVTTETQTDR